MPAPTAIRKNVKDGTEDVVMEDATTAGILKLIPLRLSNRYYIEILANSASDMAEPVINPNAIVSSMDSSHVSQNSSADPPSTQVNNPSDSFVNPPHLSPLEIANSNNNDNDISPETDVFNRPLFAPSNDVITSTTTNTSATSPTTQPSSLSTSSSTRPKAALPRFETRKIPIPPHRMTPLKSAWPEIYPPLVEHLHLQVRMNLRTRAVELRTCPPKPEDSNTSSSYRNSRNYIDPPTALQKGADFIHALSLGFSVPDAIALLRLDDLYIETFEIRDVKLLSGDHLSRAIGRIAGQGGKTKFAIENASRTRIVLADSKIHILGGFANIKVAREAVVSLILGKPPGKVYGGLRVVAGRMKERF